MKRILNRSASNMTIWDTLLLSSLVTAVSMVFVGIMLAIEWAWDNDVPKKTAEKLKEMRKKQKYINLD